MVHSYNSLVIDLGAGAGKFAIPLAKLSQKVVAIDVKPNGLRRLKTKCALVDVILADIKHLPFKANAFEFACMIEVLDYLSLDALAECSRILKQKATLVFSFGNRNSLKHKFRRILGKRYEHHYNDTLATLESLGFVVVRKHGFNWLPFNRTSNNRLVPIFAKLERKLRIGKLAISPWVMMQVRKSTK